MSNYYFLYDDIKDIRKQYIHEREWWEKLKKDAAKDTNFELAKECKEHVSYYTRLEKACNLFLAFLEKKKQ